MVTFTPQEDLVTLTESELKEVIREALIYNRDNLKDDVIKLYISNYLKKIRKIKGLIINMKDISLKLGNPLYINCEICSRLIPRLEAHEHLYLEDEYGYAYYDLCTDCYNNSKKIGKIFYDK